MIVDRKGQRCWMMCVYLAETVQPKACSFAAKIISRALEDGIWRIKHNEEILQNYVQLFFMTIPGEIRVYIGYVIPSQYKQLKINNTYFIFECLSYWFPDQFLSVHNDRISLWLQQTYTKD